MRRASARRNVGGSMLTGAPALTPRLRLVASQVRPGGAVADIGTDHALLPVYLVRAGSNPRAVAADVRPGPLESAGRNIARYGVQSEVTTVLTDGLDGIARTDDVVIAGMGGEMIVSILSRCQWIRDPAVRLVLQPMTALPELRRYLCRSGYDILCEHAAAEGRKLYVVMTAAFGGRAFEPDMLYALTGRLAHAAEPEASEYLGRMAKSYLKKAAGLRKSACRQDEAQRATDTAALIRSLTAPAGAIEPIWEEK